MHPNKLIWSSTEGPAPRRKSKGMLDPLENFEPYLVLRAQILGGKFKPMEEKGVFVRAADFKGVTGRGRAAGGPLKYPWRTVKDRLMRAIKEAGLESDYRVVMYETIDEGVWFVKVTYEPPIVKAKGGSRD